MNIFYISYFLYDKIIKFKNNIKWEDKIDNVEDLEEHQIVEVVVDLLKEVDVIVKIVQTVELEEVQEILIIVAQEDKVKEIKKDPVIGL